jgi:hypothetical protein
MTNLKLIERTIHQKKKKIAIFHSLVPYPINFQFLVIN